MSIVSLLVLVSIFKKKKIISNAKENLLRNKYPCENSLNLFLKLKMSGNE